MIMITSRSWWLASRSRDRHLAVDRAPATIGGGHGQLLAIALPAQASPDALA